MHNQILNTICSHYKIISKSVLIIQNIRLHVDYSKFTELGLIKFAKHHQCTQYLTAEENNHQVN
jgi:hypothetical protein